MTHRFINADGYVSTGTGILGHNMFAYCNNNPIVYADPSGNGPIVIIAVVVLLVGITTLFSGDTSSAVSNYETQKKENAAKKYNNNTVNVYDDTGAPDNNKLNAHVYIADSSTGYRNISIDNSLAVSSKYEMEAVIDVIISSPYYSEKEFGSKSFMMAQWQAHNMCYYIASGSTAGFNMMSFLSGSSNPIESATTLDLRSVDNTLRRQRWVYYIISWT